MFTTIKNIEDTYDFEFSETDLMLKNDILDIFNCDSDNCLMSSMILKYNKTYNKNILNNIFGLYFMYVKNDFDIAENCFKQCNNYFPAYKNLGELYFTLFKLNGNNSNFSKAKIQFSKCIDYDIEVIRRLISLDGYICNYNGVKKYNDLYRKKYYEKKNINYKKMLEQHFC